MEPRAGWPADEAGATSSPDTSAGEPVPGPDVPPGPGDAAETGEEAFEAQAVASFLQRRETRARREARDRARAKRHKALEEEAIASWLRARKTS